MRWAPAVLNSDAQLQKQEEGEWGRRTEHSQCFVEYGEHLVQIGVVVECL